MTTYNVRELQMKLLDILTCIDSICREKHITYYLAAGTMLGAVRHKGFIPWDDDVDIAMPRKDYNLLVAHCTEWLPKPYALLCAENNPDFPSDFGKIVNTDTTLIEREHHRYVGGIYIDVFPIDNITSNPFTQKIHFIQYSIYKKLIYLLCRNPYKHGHGIQCLFPLALQQLFSVSSVVEKLLMLQKKYSEHATGLVVDHDFKQKGVMKNNIYGQPKDIFFEGRLFMGVNNPDAYLKQLYGDYLTIPKANNQKQHQFYYLNYNLPYSKYEDKRPFVNK